MKRILLILIIIIFIGPTGSCQAASTSASFQFSKTFQSDQEGFALVPLDPQVLENTKDDLSDIRVGNDDGQEIPYRLMQMSPVNTPVPYAAVLNESRQPGEYSITIDFGNTAVVHNQLYMEMDASQQYLGDLYLEGSSDKLQWSLINKSKIFFVPPDYLNTSFPYPDSTWRYLRIRIAGVNLPTLQLHSLRVASTTVGATTFVQLPAQLQSNQDYNGKSELILDLGVKGYYVQQISFDSEDRNYQRPVKIYSGNDQNTWQQLGADSAVYDFRWPDYEALQNTLTVDQRASRYIKIVIGNGGNPPLKMSKITVTGASPRIIADLQPGRYHLWYGNAAAGQPQYDVARFASQIDALGLPLLTPGVQQVNPDYAPPQKPWTARHPWLLYLGLALTLSIIGLIIGQAIHHSSWFIK